MATENSIMVILDPSLQVTPALQRGIALAKCLEAPLALYLFEYDKHFDPELRDNRLRADALATYERGRRSQLEELVSSLKEDAPKIRTEFVWGRPVAAQILRIISDLKPRFVVKDVRSAPAIRHLLYAPLDWNLLRECPAPLMLVKMQEQRKLGRIAVAVDPLNEHGKPNELNTQLIKIAEVLAAKCSAEMDLVHVMDYPPPLYYPDPSMFDDIYELHEDALRKLGDAAGLSPDRQHLLEGHTRAELTQFVQKQAVDLMVFGAVQRTGLQRAFIGSTAEDILDSIDCDILIVKPEHSTASLTQRT